MKCFRVLSRRSSPSSPSSHDHAHTSHDHTHPTTTTTIPSIITTNSPTTSQASKKPGKRPPSLKFNSSSQSPSQPSVRYRATTTLVEGKGLREKMEGSNEGGRRPSNPLVLAAMENGNHSKKRGSLNIAVNPEFSRGVSVGEDSANGYGLYTPKLFKNEKLTLTYNRAHMKKPSTMADTPTPGGDTGGGFKPSGSGEDSYIPKIAARTKNWPSFLARNYFRLNNAKLCLTLLINVILLTYQVRSVSI